MVPLTHLLERVLTILKCQYMAASYDSGDGKVQAKAMKAVGGKMPQEVWCVWTRDLRSSKFKLSAFFSLYLVYRMVS